MDDICLQSRDCHKPCLKGSGSWLGFPDTHRTYIAHNANEINRLRVEYAGLGGAREKRGDRTDNGFLLYE